MTHYSPLQAGYHLALQNEPLRVPCAVRDKVLDYGLEVSKFELQSRFAQSAGAAEYIDCFSAEG